MLYTLIAVAVAIIALFITFRVAKFLWLSNWFLGFVRGIFGLSLLSLAVAIGLVSYDVYSYKQILLEQPVATINFEAIEDQHFDAVLVDSAGNQKRFNLYGDQWQLDARIIKWKGYFAGFGIKPAYRLDRLSGRYYDIGKETTAKRSTYAIIESPLTLDLWRLINQRAHWFSVVDASYGSATYMPMKNGALYEVRLSNTGLIARPLNDVASKAIAEWK